MAAPPSTSEPPVGPMTDPLAIGQVMARSGLFPDITRVSQAVVKVLAGRELGIGPFAAMSDIHIIEGKPVIGARILAALVRQSAVYDYEIVEWTNQRCAIDFYRHGQKLEPTVTFDQEDAQARRARQAHARRQALQPHEVPAQHEVRAGDVQRRRAALPRPHGRRPGVHP